MKIAIISDIHANLEALERALNVIREKSIDRIICLGDLIGYGANPNECIQLVQKATQDILIGNHDQAAIDSSVAEFFNPHALTSAHWTREQTTAENKRFISNLPYTLEREHLLFVHSSPYQPEAWHYIFSDVDARENFDNFRQSICFVGHTHVAAIHSTQHSRRESKNVVTRLQFSKEEKYIINVGSVGQPRDGDWRLSFGIFDTQQWSYETIRCEYDVQTASEKILRAGLPRIHAERILVGR